MRSAEALILGGSGTLGHILAHVCASTRQVLVTARQAAPDRVAFDALAPDSDLLHLLRQLEPNALIVNTIALPASDLAQSDSSLQRERATSINAIFPQRLAQAAGGLGLRVVQVSTDAVFAPEGGIVSEADPISPQDFYGVTKAAGELKGAHCLTIRCSFVGPPAPDRQRGLWAWLTQQPQGARVHGYVNQRWSGMTTYQLAVVCSTLVDQERFAGIREQGPVHHLAPNPLLSKFELLRVMGQVLRPDLRVEPARAETAISRVLVSRCGALNCLAPYCPDWSSALAAAAAFR
jgi:dTDP-4-dehydrorhamnose reductase